MTDPSTAPTLGLLAPAAGRLFHPDEDRLVDRWCAERSIDAVWVRDLPCLPDGDPDQGQGADPFGYLAHLHGRGTRLDVMGTASVILGTRHPLVTARAAVGAQNQSGDGSSSDWGPAGNRPWPRPSVSRTGRFPRW